MEIIRRDVDYEDGQLIATNFVVRVEHPTHQHHVWTKTALKLDESPPKDGKYYENINGSWHRDDVVPLTQDFEISVPSDYCDKLTSKQWTDVDVLLKAKAAERLAEWVESMVPKPDPRTRISTSKAALEAAVSAAQVEP